MRRTILLFVLFLILVISLTSTSPGRNPSEARTKAALASIIAINTGLDLFRRDCGAFPAPTDGIFALFRDPGIQNWNGPYLRGSDPALDPWENPFQYAVVNGVAIIRSMGADGSPKTHDDIMTPERMEISEQGSARYRR